MNSHISDIARFSEGLVNASEPCIWVPSNLLVVHEVPVPKAPRRKWLDLLPWILEDKLLQEPEELHFTIAGKRNDKLIVLVTAKSQIQAWKNTVEETGLHSYKLIPDYLALPWTSGLLSIGKSSENILVRYGELEGFSAPPGLAWHMIADLLKKSDRSLSLNLNMPKSELPENFKGKAEFSVELGHESIDWQLSNFPEKANLLSGAFALASHSNGSIPWARTAALFLLALILSFTYLDIENKRLEEEIVFLSEQNRSAFYSLFPGLTIRSGDIRATIESYISNRFRQRDSLESEAMTALLILDDAMSACNCELQSLSWANNRVELIFPPALENTVEQWDFEQYEKQMSLEADTLNVTLSRRYGQ